jgi:hypothetical protein
MAVPLQTPSSAGGYWLLAVSRRFIARRLFRSGLLTTAGASTNTFNDGVTTTSTGAGQFRQVTQQSIPANVTASFASGTLTVSAA